MVNGLYLYCVYIHIYTYISPITMMLFCICLCVEFVAHLLSVLIFPAALWSPLQNKSLSQLDYLIKGFNLNKKTTSESAPLYLIVSVIQMLFK